MKIKVMCPNCNGYLEKEVDEKEVRDNFIACGKCKVPAIVYNAETGEMIAGAPYAPGIVVCLENSAVQAIIPAGLGKEDIVQSLRAIADAIESDSKEEGLMIAQVVISLHENRMIIIKAGPECLEEDGGKKNTST